ncbi:MAG: NAD(P)H-hydrate dehydratase [Candidatus Syntrophoarchaeum sp.]|nr:NAD(P)H-hydrate dehydratase [Candidatus Syntrophoarchaeum sp.]
MRSPITPRDMKRIDRNAAYYGLLPIQLMENAGSAIAHTIKSRFDGGKIVIVAGRGNNGGDSFVAARHLTGFEVEVILSGSSGEIRTAEARANWEILERSGFKLREIRDSSELKGVSEALMGADIVLDAILGTGVSGEIKEPAKGLIDLINSSKAFKIAVDIPSGLDPETGNSKMAVKADLTVTLHRPKLGLLQDLAKKFTGEIVVEDIGIPPLFEVLTGPGDLEVVIRRDKTSHKGDNGRVLIIGGGPFAGAPALSALAALKNGADWVTLAVPDSVAKVVASFSPNLIVKPLSSDILVQEDLGLIRDLIEHHDVTVLGMGTGSDRETLDLMRSIINVSEKLVLDADGLYALDLPSKKRDIIITPHRGELSKMGVEIKGDLRAFVMDFSRQNNLTMLMKGVEDVISDGVNLRMNRSGNAGMTVGGTGDVLSGIVGSFYAICDDPLQSASAAAFVSGAAGDLAFKEYGYGLTAMDVVDRITEVKAY